MVRLLVLQVLFFLGVLPILPAQTPPEALDPAVLAGTLDNGVRYFIQKNNKPENRVELRLSVRVGSVAESPRELGLAHLVEHMEFEGTDRFGSQEIVNFLESNGMKFGADLNAQTGFTDTQYFLELPADKPEILEKGLTIVEDWAHGPKVVPELLEKEKKIVAEEKRVRMENVRGRMTNFLLPNLLAGTPYADHQPIGDMEVLKAVTPADVRRFVDRWYVPKALSVQIVGAIDPAAAEALLKKTFVRPFANAGLDPMPVPAGVPPVQADSVLRFKDPDLRANFLTWNKILPVDPQDQVTLARIDLTNFIINYALDKRFTDLTQAADPPFLQASVNASPLVGKTWVNQFQLVPKDGAQERSLEAFLTELHRTAVHGISAADFQLALAEYRSQVEAAYAKRTNITNTDRAGSLAAWALYGEPDPSDAADHQLRLETAARITPDEVNAAVGPWLATSPAKLFVMSIDKPGTEILTDAQIGAVTARVAGSSVTRTEDRKLKPLFTSLPVPGKVTSEDRVPGTPFTKWTLSNGLAVYLYKNDFTKNEVQVQGAAPGGLSLVPDQDYLSAAYGPTLFSSTGLGDLSLGELNDFLTGHQAEAGVYLDGTGAFVGGTAVPGDLLQLFQMLNRKFTPPRRDPAAETSFLKQTAESLKNSQDLPNQLYQNEILRLLSSGATRSKPVRTDRLGEIVPEKAAWYYSKFFTGAPGFTFVITGDFDEGSLKPLVETYLASLAGGPGTPTKDLGIRPAPGPVTSVVKKGQDKKAVVSLYLPVPAPYSLDREFVAAALEEVLDIRLREVVRQDKEGTYNVNVGINLDPLPYPRAQTWVNFTCDPARQNELLKAVTDELRSLAAGNLTDEVFSKVLEIRKRTVETNQKNNGWWARAGMRTLFNGQLPQDLANEPDFYAWLTKDTVTALAKELLDPSKALTVILNPEK